MQVRRVVTGHSREGKSIVASDLQVQGQTATLFPEMEIHPLWGADETLTFPDDGSMPDCPDYYPGVGGFRFGAFSVPPDTAPKPIDADRERGREELAKKWPDMLATMDPDDPGMHITDTVDFAYIISGEVWLELDDRQQVHLKVGDTVVQNGTRHAWRNKSGQPCVIAFCLVGANRARR